MSNNQEPFAIAISIDLAKVDAYVAEHPERVIEGKNGARYLNLDLKLNKNGPDNFGKTHSLSIGATKEERASKQFPPFVGNGKAFYPFDQEKNARAFPNRPARQYPTRQPARPATTRQAPPVQPDYEAEGDDDRIPF